MTCHCLGIIYRLICVGFLGMISFGLFLGCLYKIIEGFDSGWNLIITVLVTVVDALLLFVLIRYIKNVVTTYWNKRRRTRRTNRSSKSYNSSCHVIACSSELGPCISHAWLNNSSPLELPMGLPPVIEEQNDQVIQ